LDLQAVNGTRSGSPSEAAEFAALTKRDAQIRMEQELKTLLTTCDEKERPVCFKQG